MEKIKMTTPIVEMDGDEMTRIVWKLVKDELLSPYVELLTEYYDLGLTHRDETEDKVTIDAANACNKYGVGVKCATITPNAARMEEYKLKKMYKSPNGTIRSIMDGTVFRTPIIVNCIKPHVHNWVKPITIARHAYGDIYKNTEMLIDKPGVAELVFTAEDGSVRREVIHEFKSPGVLQGVHNLNRSIESFAQACFEYALSTGQSLMFGAKDTISKTYDGEFKKIFETMYEEKYKTAFTDAGITYSYKLIDDIVAKAIVSDGGFIWACKNYDGDVMSDMLGAAYGSMPMMTSVLVSPAGNYEYEAAHGTVQDQYYDYLEGRETSVNPLATIYAWAGALRMRGLKDGIKELPVFAGQLEAACIKTIQDGVMTGDLAAITTMEKEKVQRANTQDFIKAIRQRLDALVNA